MKRRLLVRRSLGEGGILFLLLLVALLGGLAWFLFHQPPEPVYQGKPLHEWLAGYTAPLQLTLGPDPGASEAVRHIGTNAIPTLLEMLQEKDSPFKLKWIALLQKQHFIRPPQPAYLRNIQAATAFEVLGAAAGNAAPTLVRVYRMKISISSQQQTLRALRGICSGFPDANPVFLDALSSTNLILRQAAADAIRQAHPQSDAFVPALINALKDPDFIVRSLAAEDLAGYSPAAKTAVPALVALLNDPNSYVRRAATNALKKIDPVAAANAGIK